MRPDPAIPADCSSAELDVDADGHHTIVLPFDCLDELREEGTPIGGDLVLPPHTGNRLDDAVGSEHQNGLVHLDGVDDVVCPAADGPGVDLAGVEVRDFDLAVGEVHTEIVRSQLLASLHDADSCSLDLFLAEALDSSPEAVLSLGPVKVGQEHGSLVFEFDVHGCPFLRGLY